MPDRAKAAHLLYRTTPIDSYVERIHRLGHGETLTWSPGETTPRTELTEPLEPAPHSRVVSIPSSAPRPGAETV
ncbi:hypothetical protein [Natrinema sp. 1APR25-10V2]|uniref:hypothetical protein n=1 Tax=Natrinema sp. 1APR25-10V2 TaxID=2951081 RepID=UPI002875D85B|nr:hypothetical protein [Natrinema sp. 1APR25-10V2]MDS0476560.1 hypothetical protein [Natrinema sp. 1APR25-10V2]